MPKSLHHMLIQLIEALDYTEYQEIAFLNASIDLLPYKNKIEKPVLGGVCHGFTIKWLEAEFLHQKEQFTARVDRIIHSEFALKKIKELKIKNLKNITTQKSISELRFFVELLGTDILAFLDSLMLFHQPEKFDDFFQNPYLDQIHYQHISTLASSDQIRDRGGLVKIHAQPGMYSKHEL